MKATKRLAKIEKYIAANGFASVKELSSLCDVSEMTIRRDLDKLANENRIIRTYGGGAPTPAASVEFSDESQLSTTSADRSAFTCGADVLITTSFDPKYDPIISGNGGQAKFPIVSESVPHRNCVTCVGIDNYAAGVALGTWAGEYAINNFAGKANVLNLTYSLPNTEARSKGFLTGLVEKLEELDTVTSLNPQSRFDLAYQLTRDALEVNDAINIIFAINDTSASGAIQACIDLQIDPEKIVVISFGLEGDTIKNELKDGHYYKVTLAMFPEIVGRVCIDAAILAYQGFDLPESIVTPYALLTKDTLTDFYIPTETGWEILWKNAQERLEIPRIQGKITSTTESPMPDCIGILVPFSDHEWYQNMLSAMHEYASTLKTKIEILDAEKNLTDELESRRRDIARRAVQEIQSGDTIFVDGGIVTQYLVELIHAKKEITVISNSLPVLDVLEDNPEITLVSTGGILRRNNKSLVGPIAESSLKDMRVDKLFLTVSGASLDFGLSHTNMSEVTIKQAMINSAREVILLADHTKFEQESLIQISPIRAVNKLITDSGLSAKLRLALNSAGIEVLLSERKETSPDTP